MAHELISGILNSTSGTAICVSSLQKPFNG